MVRPVNNPTAEKLQARPRRSSDGGSLRDAFLGALTRRVARDPTGRVILPVGPVDVTELAQVLRAIDRARQAGGRR